MEYIGLLQFIDGCKAVGRIKDSICDWDFDLVIMKTWFFAYMRIDGILALYETLSNGIVGFFGLNWMVKRFLHLISFRNWILEFGT